MQFDYRLLAANPAILQLSLDDKAFDIGFLPFTFLGLAPGSVNPQGHVTAAEIWSISCRPDDPEATNEPASGPLYPGLLEMGSNCTAESAANFGEAARLSRPEIAPLTLRFLGEAP